MTRTSFLPRPLGVAPIWPLPCMNPCGVFMLQNLNCRHSRFLSNQTASGRYLVPSASLKIAFAIFLKQLAEAELIVLSKSDLLKPAEVEVLRAQVERLVGKIPVTVMSAKTGSRISEWVDQLMGERTPGEHNLDLDYEVYGQAEATLGWLNATVDLVSDKEFLPAELGEAVVGKIQAQCLAAESAIAHLKILLVTAGGSDRIALTTSASQAVWDGEGNLGLVREASAIINARVGAKPEDLRRIVEGALQFAARERGVSASVLDLESFAPAPPKRPVLRSAN